MKTLKDYLIEKSTMYYHGRPNGDTAIKIIANGYLQPGNEGKGSENNTTPIAGQTYFSKLLNYSIIYAIGADMIGQELPDSMMEKSTYGFLFVIDPSEIKNKLPDEDIVGEILYEILINDESYEALDDYRDDIERFWKHRSEEIMLSSDEVEAADDESYTMTSYERFESGDYDMFALVGKYAIRYLDDDILEAIAQISNHFSTTGKIKFKEAWKFDKRKTKELKQDGSNFFDIAERVK